MGRKHTEGRGEGNQNILFTCMKRSKNKLHKKIRVAMDTVAHACKSEAFSTEQNKRKQVRLLVKMPFQLCRSCSAADSVNEFSDSK